jgi:ATP-dependent DNA helicase DinG
MRLSRAILPVRESRGLVALLDSRVLHRNYGKQVLAALSPYDRVHHLNQDWMTELEQLHDRDRYDRTA